MNQIKLSTKIQEGRNARLSVKLNMESLGLDWKASDVVRVFSYKEDGAIVLKRIPQKTPKAICHTLTKTGGGNFTNDVGVFINHRHTRFKADFAPVNSINARYRFLDAEKTMLKIYMPKEIFAQA